MESNAIISSESVQEDSDVIPQLTRLPQASQMVTGSSFEVKQKSVGNTIEAHRSEIADIPVDQQMISSRTEVTVPSPNV